MNRIVPGVIVCVCAALAAAGLKLGPSDAAATAAYLSIVVLAVVLVVESALARRPPR